MKIHSAEETKGLKEEFSLKFMQPLRIICWEDIDFQQANLLITLNGVVRSHGVVFVHLMTKFGGFHCRACLNGPKRMD